MILDEYLVCEFLQMKFKVRMTTKSAQCGIKIYAVTDADTDYNITSIGYTGKDRV